MNERTLRSVRCEKHGMRYDPQATDGCVICRRESGGQPAMGRGGRSSPAGFSPAASRSTAGPALAVGFALVLGAGLLFTALHALAARSLARLMGEPATAEELGGAERLEAAIQDPQSEILRELALDDAEDEAADVDAILDTAADEAPPPPSPPSPDPR